MTARRLARPLALALLACISARAGDAPAPYVALEQRLGAEALSSVGLTPAQVRQLDELLRQAQSREVAAQADAPSRAPAASSADRARMLGLDAASFVATVQGPVDGWQPGTVFVLANGQQWTVLKGHMRLPKTRQSPHVRLVPGVAGRWFLEVDPDLPKARVYRAD